MNAPAGYGRRVLIVFAVLAAMLPWSAVQARNAKQPGTTFRDCAECPQMTVLPAGAFLMGSSDPPSAKTRSMEPRHEVRFAAPFAVSTFEVTFAQYAQFVRETGYRGGDQCVVWSDHKSQLLEGKNWRDPNFPQTAKLPVGCVSWDDGKAYVAWLAGKTGKPYRLPSEAEWEYAARAGSYTAYSFGDDPDDICRYGNSADLDVKAVAPEMLQAFSPGTQLQFANCHDGFALTSAPVGSYEPNRFGLYDMHGNVWEWVEDCHSDSYVDAPSDGSAWTAPGCELRILRGGGWGIIPDLLRSALRLGREHEHYSKHAGFRIARNLP